MLSRFGLFKLSISMCFSVQCADTSSAKRFSVRSFLYTHLQPHRLEKQPHSAPIFFLLSQFPTSVTSRSVMSHNAHYFY